MNDVLIDLYNAGDLPAHERLARLQRALTAMNGAMTELDNRVTTIAAEADAGVHAPEKATALLKEVTAQQRKLTAKVVMLERIIALLDSNVAS